MAIFISYSHRDRTFAKKLALRLAKNNAHIWIDEWELNVGDSLMERIPSAIQNASAILFVLSKASVKSAWCKKELNAALIRELEEKKVIVLPVLKEACKVPPFLREKKYADFRSSFNAGFNDLLSAVARVSNPAQGRIRCGKAWVDWAETWGYNADAFNLEWELVQFNPKSAVTILTTISVTCNQSATNHYKKYEKLGLDWIARLAITNTLVEMMRKENIQVYIEDARPQFTRYALRDIGSEREYDVLIRCRRMGVDNGKVQLVTVSEYLHQMGEYVRKISRRPTPEEAAGLAQIAASS